MIASLLLLSLPLALANPVPTSSPAARPSSTPAPRGFSTPLSHGKGAIARSKAYSRAKSASKRGFVERDERDLPSTWLLWAGAKVDSKYNNGTGALATAYTREVEKKRSDNGEITLTDHSLDTSYSASLSVGTPAQSLEVVLDTGSSDLWVASDDCSTTACESMTTYSASDSTSALNLTTAFSIEYGSGTASGALMQDLVTLGGYSVASQTFANCDDVSSGLLSTGVSGIMGLSWETLAYSGATPWWITLAESSAWDDPLFAFYLARYRDVSGATTTESDGGIANFGYLDSSLYSGDVTYVTVDDDAEYWQIEIASAIIQSTSISLGSSNMAAIDTGTTLIGAPESIVAAIYAEISGSQQMTGSYSSYYEYPCDTSIDFELEFGNYTITISDQDFNLGRYSSNTSMCTGAVYIQELSSSSPVQWIVGDAALKNTYTVFRYTPSAVGFADLASDVTSSEAAQSTTIIDASSLLVAATSTASTSATTSVVATSSAAASVSSSASAASSTADSTVVTSVSSAIAHVVSVGTSTTSSIGTATVSSSTSSASAEAANATSAALPLVSVGQWLVAALGLGVGIIVM